MLLVAAAISGTIGLYAYAISLGPRALPLAQISAKDEGTTVRTQGLVGTPRVTSNGGLNFNLTDPAGGGLLKVYIPGEVFGLIPNRGQIVLGASVEVTGRVQEFRGSLEIRVEGKDDARVLEAAGEVHLSLEYFTSHPDAFAGMEVILTGHFSFPRVISADRGDMTTFLLQDRTYNSTYRVHAVVYRWDWKAEPRNIGIGDTVEFKGKVAYYQQEALWQITSNGPDGLQRVKSG